MPITLAKTPQRYQPCRETKPELDERVGEYRLRFANSEADLMECQALRFRVFNLELGEGLPASHATGLDQDPYDDSCDHLIVEEARSGQVVGTYRMQTYQSAHEALGYYSANEYEVESLPARLLEDSLELGRACIEKPHRNRRVLFLLWRGLAAYSRWNRKTWMLGCSSLTTTSPEVGFRAYDWICREGQVRLDLHVPVRSEFACERPSGRCDLERFELPPLFAAYLRHGARVCSPPALDAEFRTVDFLTLIDWRDLRPRFRDTLMRGLPF